MFNWNRFLIFHRELPVQDSEKTHQEKDNECYESQDEMEAPKEEPPKKITKQVTFDSSELDITSKTPISSIGASTSFS